MRSQLYTAEDLDYLPPAEAKELRAFCLEISRQLSAWIQSMQTLNFKAGPRYHKEPDRAWERLAQKAGLERQSDGRYIKVREAAATYGKQEDETQQYGKREDGKRKKGARENA